ncbi:DUF4157 domain-containing protein [Micromonospora sp. NPDC000442]|uniref:eCIS core domain-containing protein n=1 Tax=Micromonospora sp. NPDC000442 TaxID=3364217 RepID=UPI0036757D66
MRAHDPPERDAPNRHTQPTRPGTGTAPLTSSMAAILTLQRRAGNAAVTRAVQRQRSDHGHSDHEHHDERRPEAQPVQRSIVHDVLRSGGTPLAEPVRRDMEARLGADFSDVRLHTDALAQRSAAEIGARAYTSGSHVVIGQGGGDRHTLAHELTHVIQQRSGPVAGTDVGHGLRVSDPGDAYERAAEANATRALAAPHPQSGTEAVGGDGRTVQCAPEARSPAGPGGGSPVPVQRWAWVDGTRVDPDEAGLNPQMRALASDELVHRYEDLDEFRDHAAGRSDYIGNLPADSTSPNTWVRFRPPGTTNLIGEDHTKVTLDEILRAVGALGSKSFKYEPFAVDKLRSGSAMKAAYKKENTLRFAQFGIEGESDKRRFGAESLYPKMGDALTGLLPYLNGVGRIDELKSDSGEYAGQPYQRYLKIAWGYGLDVVNEPTLIGLAKSKESRDATKALKAAIEPNRDKLDQFINQLTVDGYLGDALSSPAGQDVLPALRQFCAELVKVLLLRVNTDEKLEKDEKEDLAGMSTASTAEQGKLFAEWRDLHFLHAVQEAVRSGVRYVGMGRDHLDYMIPARRPDGTSAYDMITKDLARFEEATRTCEELARGTAAAPVTRGTGPRDPYALDF